jgi:hypothetical protein
MASEGNDRIVSEETANEDADRDRVASFAGV